MAPVEAPRPSYEQQRVSIAPAPAQVTTSTPATSASASVPSTGSHLPFIRTVGVADHDRRKSMGSDRSQSSVSPSRAGSQFGPSHDTPSGSSANSRIKKTLADTLATQQGVVPPRKRKRVHYSCAECHRRKHRCDRNIPCQPCLDRGLGDSCRPFQDGDEFGDERDRLKRLEDLVEGLARAHASLADEMEAFKASEGVSKAANASSISKTEDADESDDETNTDSEAKGERPAKRNRIGPTPIDIEREELRKGSLLSEDPGHSGAYGGAGEDMLAANNSLEGGLTREGDSFYGALALPSVSRGVIETQVSGSGQVRGVHHSLILSPDPRRATRAERKYSAAIGERQGAPADPGGWSTVKCDRGADELSATERDVRRHARMVLS